MISQTIRGTPGHSSVCRAAPRHEASNLSEQLLLRLAKWLEDRESCFLTSVGIIGFSSMVTVMFEMAGVSQGSKVDTHLGAAGVYECVRWLSVLVKGGIGARG